MTKELSGSDNIKSKQTRKAVQSALVSIIDFIKKLKEVPKNGIVICSSDERIYIINPPKPITKVIYWCGRNFELFQVLDLFEEYDSHGVILISGKVTRFYKVSKNEINLIKIINVELPNRQGRGGQSKLRFERITEEKRNNYVKKVSEMAVNYYTRNGRQFIIDLVIGGFGEFKDDLKYNELMCKYFPNIKVIDIPDITDESIYTIINKINLDGSSHEEDSFIEEIDNEISKCSDIEKIVFGYDNVLENLECNLIRKLLTTKLIYEKIEKIINSKVKVIFLTNKDFIKKFGEVVGIKYY